MAISVFIAYLITIYPLFFFLIEVYRGRNFINEQNQLNFLYVKRISLRFILNLHFKMNFWWTNFIFHYLRKENSWSNYFVRFLTLFTIVYFFKDILIPRNGKKYSAALLSRLYEVAKIQSNLIIKFQRNPAKPLEYILRKFIQNLAHRGNIPAPKKA